MALKKENRTIAYTDRIGVNRGGGFEYASRVAQQQANSIDNLVGKFADAGLQELKDFGEEQAIKAIEMYDFADSEVKIKNPITQEQESVYFPSKVEIPDTLPKSKTAIETFEKGIYKEYEKEVLSALEQIAVDERKLALTNFTSGADYESVVTSKFNGVLENVNPKFKDYAERLSTSLINQHGSVVVSNYNSYQRNIKNSKFNTGNKQRRDTILTNAIMLGPDHPKSKLLLKQYESFINDAKTSNVIDAVANGSQLVNEMKIAQKVYKLFEPYNIQNIETASPVELKLAVDNYRNISLLMTGNVQNIVLKKIENGEIKETTIDSETFGNIAGENSSLIKDIEITYNKVANRLNSKLDSAKSVSDSTFRWQMNEGLNTKGFSSQANGTTAKERRKDWNNVGTIQVWMNSYNKYFPNEPIDQATITAGSSSYNPNTYYKFVKFVAQIDNNLPQGIFDSIEQGYKDFNPKNIRMMRDSGLVNYLLNKPSYASDDIGESILINTGGVKNFGFSNEAINKMIAIEQALILNPNLEEVIIEQKELFNKFSQEGKTLSQAIKEVSNNTYSNATEINDHILSQIDDVLNTKFMNRGDVTFPTILYGAVKEEIHSGILAGHIRFRSLSDLNPYIENALGGIAEGNGVFGESKIGYSQFTASKLDKGDYQKALKYVMNSPEDRFGVPIKNEKGEVVRSTEYMNPKIMSLFKRSNEFNIYKDFKPEIGTNIYLESIQKTNQQFPSYYIVFVNPDGKADYLQNENGLLMTYNPKPDFDAYKEKNNLSDISFNEYKKLSEQRDINLTTAPTKSRKERRDNPVEPINIGEKIVETGKAVAETVQDFFTFDGVKFSRELSKLEKRQWSKSKKLPKGVTIIED